jgi:DNA-binding transcriptional LysR family regulator
MTLHELESALGARLFERLGRKLGLSGLGQQLLPHALQVLDSAAEFAERALIPNQQAGTIELGASRTIGPFVAPELINDFRAARPHARIALAVANTHELVDLLKQHRLDCALIEGVVTDASLERHAWLDDELCLFARAGHPMLDALAHGARPGPYLAQADWIVREPGSGTRELFLQALAPIVPQPRTLMQVNDPQAMKTLVMQSDALGCLSRLAIVDELADGRLAEIAPPNRSIARSLRRVFWIVWHRGRPQSGAVQHFIAHALGWRPSLRVRRAPALRSSSKTDRSIRTRG